MRWFIEHVRPRIQQQGLREADLLQISFRKLPAALSAMLREVDLLDDSVYGCARFPGRDAG
jgi:hypothetical protein